MKDRQMYIYTNKRERKRGKRVRHIHKEKDTHIQRGERDKQTDRGCVKSTNLQV